MVTKKSKQETKLAHWELKKKFSSYFSVQMTSLCVYGLDILRKCDQGRVSGSQ